MSVKENERKEGSFMMFETTESMISLSRITQQHNIRSEFRTRFSLTVGEQENSVKTIATIHSTELTIIRNTMEE